jgi:hypothetical protein
MLQVPIGAVFDAGKGPGVWAIENTPTKVVWRKVKIQGLDDHYAQIEGDLKKGTLIVTLGANLLHEGEHVRVLNDTHTTHTNTAHISKTYISAVNREETE